MQNAKHLRAAGLNGDVTKRSEVAGNRVLALWHTVIGKKIVMAVTGVVPIGFVIAHMVGNPWLSPALCNIHFTKMPSSMRSQPNLFSCSMTREIIREEARPSAKKAAVQSDEATHNLLASEL